MLKSLPTDGTIKIGPEDVALVANDLSIKCIFKDGNNSTNAIFMRTIAEMMIDGDDELVGLVLKKLAAYKRQGRI